ncbi:MAG: DUF4956 domain-containing protein [Firmicutes bacterium]|nr:DUF4956 domain-containing protein [Bacillota bacterium]
MLNSIFHDFSFMIQDALLAMLISLALGLVIALLYKLTTPAGGGVAGVLAVLPLLVCTIIMVINGDLGASVALLGAFGLIRFRSAPGSARDIAFIFFSMAVGLTAGLGFLTLAGLVTLITGAALLLSDRTGFSSAASRERSLRITIPEDLSYGGLFDDLFTVYTKKAVLEQVKTASMGTMYQLLYRVELRRNADEKEFLDALRCRNGNLELSLGLVRREKNAL